MATASTTTATVFRTGISDLEKGFEAGKEAASKAIGKLGDVKPQFGIVFCSARYDYKEVLRGIRSIAGDAHIIGCSSASEFTEEKVTKDSVACAFMNSNNHKFFTALAKGLKSNPVSAIEHVSGAFPTDVPEYPHQSAIMLIDGLSGKGEEVCAAALTVLGPTVRFSGGAAGDNLTFNKTAVFHNDQSVSDAASLCFMASKKPVSIGVKHGHCAISPPLTITKVRDNVVKEVENRPAFDVWKEHTKDKAKQKGIDVEKLQNASDIGSFLMQYEAGLLTGAEYKVRAPLSVNPDNSINFACAMVEGSVIRIMESPNKYYQIASAKEAAEIAFKGARGAKLAGAIVFDCVCRNLILDKEFQKGVEEIKKVIGDVPVIGFATYGEIAMQMGQLSGFHNTTTVVLLIPE
ncbi:MAG TPA: FIST N-terminal domain-containing protein [Candidatus Obscuribacterales bacterium]